jgi:hypothetical protein
MADKEKKKSNGTFLRSFRAGVLSVGVFEQEFEVEGKKGKQKSRSYTLQRAYKDKQDEWQHTNGLREQDLLPASKLLEVAYGSMNIKQKDADEAEEKEE